MTEDGRTFLKRIEFLVLSALAEGALHGYGIVVRLRERTEGEVQLRAGGLYRVLDRLMERGWIEKTDPPVKIGDEVDDRRQYYAITPEGVAVARREARILAQVGRALIERPLGGSGEIS